MGATDLQRPQHEHRTRTPGRFAFAGGAATKMQKACAHDAAVPPNPHRRAERHRSLARPNAEDCGRKIRATRHSGTLAPSNHSPRARYSPQIRSQPPGTHRP
eukprot:6488586-Prymnesium_polylepis.1